MTEADEVAEIVAKIKRAALDAEYYRRLKDAVAPVIDNPDVGLFNRPLRTSSWQLAARGAARQGLDAGRWGALADCPYPELESVAQTFLRRAWLLGYAAGRKATPRPAPGPIAHTPVEILDRA